MTKHSRPMYNHFSYIEIYQNINFPQFCNYIIRLYQGIILLTAVPFWQGGEMFILYCCVMCINSNLQHFHTFHTLSLRYMCEQSGKSNNYMHEDVSHLTPFDKQCKIVQRLKICRVQTCTENKEWNDSYDYLRYPYAVLSVIYIFLIWKS